MTERIEINAALTIDRPLAEVRAQYGDMDHHMRNNVHPGIRFTWLPSEGGARKLVSEFRLLGLLQRDTLSLHDEADGTLVIDHLDGPNTGTKIFHRFVAEGSDRTRVELTASVPAATSRKLLGPLFRLGVRTILEKALREDKRDLERGTYRPGAAAGDVKRATGLLEAVSKRIRTSPQQGEEIARALIECASLAAVSDGVVEDAERDALRMLGEKLQCPAVDGAAIDAALDAAAKLSRDEAVRARARALGERLSKLGVARDAVVAAAVVALATKGIGVSELAVLQTIAEGGELESIDLERAIGQVEGVLRG